MRNCNILVMFVKFVIYFYIVGSWLKYVNVYCSRTSTNLKFSFSLLKSNEKRDPEIVNHKKGLLKQNVRVK